MKMDGFYRKSSRDMERPFSVSMFADGEGTGQARSMGNVVKTL
jgi:hypothetical protein